MSVKFFSNDFPDTWKAGVDSFPKEKHTLKLEKILLYLANDVEDAHNDLVQVAVLHDVQMMDKHPFQASPDSPLHLSVEGQRGTEVIEPKVCQVVNLAEEENQTPSSTLSSSLHGRFKW